MPDGHAIWYLIPALLICGAVAAGISYWAANAYIGSQHTGDPFKHRAVSSHRRTLERGNAPHSRRRPRIRRKTGAVARTPMITVMPFLQLGTRNFYAS